jgi:hypothetical protein
VSDFGVSSYFSHEKEKEFKSLRHLPHSSSRGVVRKTEGRCRHRIGLMFP